MAQGSNDQNLKEIRAFKFTDNCDTDVRTDDARATDKLRFHEFC